MSDLVLHPSIVAALERYHAHPAQAVVLVGQPGVGKGSLLQRIAATLLDSQPDRLGQNAQFLGISNDTHIGIDDIRRLQHFLMLKPADAGHATRVITIENAERMTLEAQNALLKSIEEPPDRSYLLLSTTSVNQLLPTILSRTQLLTIPKPSAAVLKAFFAANGHASNEVERAYTMSAGLPGAMASLLAGDTTHPMLQAADTARRLLQSGKFERLIAIDQLAKDRAAAIQTCEILAHMAEISLKRQELPRAQQDRWQHVLGASLNAADMLRKNAQAKLVLTAMSLAI